MGNENSSPKINQQQASNTTMTVNKKPIMKSKTIQPNSTTAIQKNVTISPVAKTKQSYNEVNKLIKSEMIDNETIKRVNREKLSSHRESEREFKFNIGSSVISNYPGNNQHQSNKTDNETFLKNQNSSNKLKSSNKLTSGVIFDKMTNSANQIPRSMTIAEVNDNPKDSLMDLKSMNTETKVQLPQSPSKTSTANKSMLRKMNTMKPTSSLANQIAFDGINIDIENFEFIKVIGKGTFGKVVLVKGKLNGHLYALKSIKKHFINTGKNLENLKFEKKVLAMVNHPFLVKFHDTFQTKDKVHMIFDYYNGGELFFHLTQMKRFSEDLTRFYAAEVYLALSYLHNKGIIYRDLKPENVLLDRYGHIKIVDFGLAKDNISMKDLTKTICGTNEYVPPEVIKGNKYGFNFDWWGYGILIYEFLSGFPPFTDKDKASLFNKILLNDPNINGLKVSNDCKDLLKLLLAKDVSKRIQPKDIPLHPWFKDYNFNDLEALKIKPLFIPRVTNEQDTSNIDPTFLNSELNSPIKKKRIQIDQSKFDNL